LIATMSWQELGERFCIPTWYDMLAMARANWTKMRVRDIIVILLRSHKEGSQCPMFWFATLMSELLPA
jgi:hypothetical protein